jgi:CBS domain-containing protein
MKIAEIMTKQPKTIDASATVLEAAKQLAEKDIGMLPVAKNDRLLGILTDRDIVVRVVAKGQDPAHTPVGSVVSGEPKYCFEDQDAELVARNMDDLLVRRLPVMDRSKRLVGVVSIEDIRPRHHS